MPSWIKYALLGLGVIALAVAATVVTNVLMAPKSATPPTVPPTPPIAATDKGKAPVVTGEPAPVVAPKAAPTKYVLVLDEGESKKKAAVVRFVGVEVVEKPNLGGVKPDPKITGDQRSYDKHKLRHRGVAEGSKVEVIYDGIINWYVDIRVPRDVPVYYGKLPE